MEQTNGLLPIFKETSKEELTERFQITFPEGEAVTIELPCKQKTNRLTHQPQARKPDIDGCAAYPAVMYDVQMTDDAGKTYQALMHMNEEETELLALDTWASCGKRVIPIRESPFSAMVKHYTNYENAK